MGNIKGKSQYTEWFWRISELSHHGWIDTTQLKQLIFKNNIKILYNNNLPTYCSKISISQILPGLKIRNKYLQFRLFWFYKESLLNK